MNKTQIQSLIENLRIQTAANSITPNMLANILTELNENADNSNTQSQCSDVTVTSSTAPLLYCEVQNGRLYLRNYEYYQALNLEPVLFRYIKKKNRWNIEGLNRRYGPKKKGWFANGKLHTITVSEEGLVKRNYCILTYNNSEDIDYRHTPDTFVTDNANTKTRRGVTWGCSTISNCVNENYRMVRLPFAIGFAPKIECETTAITVANLVSNLAPFFIRGQKNRQGDYEWAFSR